MANIAVFVSGGGTNFQTLIDGEKNGIITHGQICLCVSSTTKAYALERAANNNIATAVIRKKEYTSEEEFADAIQILMNQFKIDLIVLAGYLSILPHTFIKNFSGRIINMHPSLIPSFCGKGFYGLKVHEAALEYGVKVTGATVHYVNEIVDGGKIILQKAVYIEEGDTPEILQKRVLEQAEWVILPKAVELVCSEIEQQTK